MRPILALLLLSFLIFQDGMAQKATIREEMLEMKTYPFSEPNPVPEIGRIYPYYSFDGYTSKPVDQKWKMVVLENDYIKVYVCPDIGGKVWGAIEKSTGKEFLYFNHVVKFRDVAMRGPWTSGGLEYNFGDIGHIPTCATPVDYLMKENPDGSVSCVVGAIDLPSGTKWSVEISVHPNKAYFETQTRWFNKTSLPCTYYHWMNAAAKSAGNLEFIYPGSNWIGHGGAIGEWPHENGRDINFYENNNFGSYKSYHVLNSYTDFFGGYWHDDDFGFVHWSNYDDKPGKKLWIWGLSQQGMIWEDLLTDNDGQYIEFQAGKLFNQAANNSTLTPFKHKEFAPYDTDVMHEMWFPLKETGGMVAVSPNGVLNIEKSGEKTKAIFSAFQAIDDELLIIENGEILSQTNLNLKPLEKMLVEFIPKSENFVVSLGGKLLYSSNPAENIVERPIEPNEKFNWESAYGLYTKALELEKQRMYGQALETYELVLQKDPGFLPALNRLALGHYRRMNYQKALQYLLQSLSIDTYDSEANFLYGLVNRKLGKYVESKSGFSISAASVSYRAAAYIELSKLFLTERDYIKSLEYAGKALNFSADNPVAHQLMAVSYRKMEKYSDAEISLDKLYELDATNHFVRFEHLLFEKTEEAKEVFIGSITNELPIESYIDLGIFYNDLNCKSEAITVFNLAPHNPVRDIWLARLDDQYAKTHLNNVISASPYLVFPFRNETAEILEDLILQNDNWKLKYYLGLIYWNRGLTDAALDLFKACGSVPDFAPFYVSRAKLLKNSEEQLADMLRANELDQKDWRPAMGLVDLYLLEGKAEKALPIAKRYMDEYPEQSAIGLAYARTLMKMNKYQESIRFLESYYVLPFEGATVGRDLFHEACIRVANNALKANNFKEAISAAKKALEWPVNLGVGKPYDVDERMENYIIARGYEGLNQQKKANTYIDKIAMHPNNKFPNEGSKLIFQLLAFNRLTKFNEADNLFESMIQKYPDNQYLEWVKLIWSDKGSEAGKLADQILGFAKIGMPYSTDFKDVDFELVSDIFKEK